MGTVTCAACGAQVLEQSTYFGGSGPICAACHALDEQVTSDRFRAGAEQSLAHDGVDGVLVHTVTEVEEHADGSVVTRTRSTRVDAGALGFLFELFGWFRRWWRRPY